MPRRTLSDSARVTRALNASNRGARTSASPGGISRLLVGLALLIALIWAGRYRASDMGPALGRLLDPANGIWTAARATDPAGSADATIPGLGDSAQVTYDDRGVPHIRARNQLDLYRALGYVVARDRLFQLELQTRAAAGTLSELVGSIAVIADRETRQLGMPRAAEKNLAALDMNSFDGMVIRAYAEGVNAHIASLAVREYPIEFRLLDAEPSRWEPLHSLHLLNRMALTLSHSSAELTHMRARALVGRQAADALYPVFSPIQEPVQPMSRNAPRFDNRRIPPPGAPDSQAIAIADLRRLAPGSSLAHVRRRSDAVNGSNNWAVAPERTAAGRALIAGDQHLDLTLPSIWYEVHLTVPDTLDVYGVTIPGAPFVVVGFNRALAWTFTNTEADVTDYYVETVDDAESPTRYMLDGSWRDLEIREERYRGRRNELLHVDTVRYTHRGPMDRVLGQWISMRWMIEQGGREVGALLGAQRAKSVDEWLSSMETYSVPAQNMLVADTSGSIAIRSTGRFPLRADTGRGDLLRDGSSSASDWIGYWNVQDYPQAANPAQGYLASANQQPLEPYVNTRYLGSDWPAPWRALRINELLRERRAFTTEDMRRFQTDPRSPRAELFMPAFLASAREAAVGRDAVVGAELLSEWNLEYTPDNRRAALFEAAMAALSAELWDELRADTARAPTSLPSSAVVAQLLNDPTSEWWDNPSTVERETRDVILARSLGIGYRRMLETYGEPGSGQWRWDNVRPANIRHMLGIEDFSALKIPVRGGATTLSPFSSDGEHGPSWRMVVELGPQIRAWGALPGGPSGNPFSTRYRDGILRWASGEMDEIFFPADASVLESRTSATLTLRPGKQR